MTLSRRDLRALQVGSVVVLFALTFVLVLRPSLNRRALLIDQLSAEVSLLERERAAIAEGAPTTATNVAGDSLVSSVQSRVFGGSDDVIATSGLVEHLSMAAEAGSVWLQQVNTKPAGETGASLRELRAEFRAAGDLAGVLRFLGALEDARPLVDIERLDVTAGSTSEDDDRAPLTISATVVGFASRSVSVPVIMDDDAPGLPMLPATDSVVAQLAAHDMFSPYREARAVPDRLAVGRARPGSVEVPSDVDSTVELPTVHGTAVDARGESFAMAAVNGGPVIVVRVGEKLGPFTVLSIERAQVLFRAADGRRHRIDANDSPDGAAP